VSLFLPGPGPLLLEPRQNNQLLPVTTSEARVQLGALSAPGDGTQVLWIRARSTSDPYGTLTATLYDSDGTTVRGTDTFTLTTSFQTFALTPAGVTDWSALQVGFLASGAGALTAEVSWIELQIPAAAVSSFVVTASDSVTFAESPAATLHKAVTASDSITFAESLARIASKARTATDSVTFSENVTVQAGKTRTITDSITFAESLTRTSLGISRTATDSLTFSEALSRTKSGARTSTDTITFSESVASSQGKTRTSTDSVTFSESLTRAALGKTRSSSDSITFSESAARTQTLTGRTGSDSVAFSESVAASKGISRTISDAITFSESLTRSGVGRIRSASDSATFSDTLTRGTQTFTGRTGVDSVSFSESLVAVVHTALGPVILTIAPSDRERINLHVFDSGRVSVISNDTLKSADLPTNASRTRLVITVAPRVDLSIADRPAQ